jgi:hypothetical protein
MSGLLCWRERQNAAGSESFTLTTTFLLTGTALILPSTIAIYDQFLLLPGVLWLYTHRDRVLRGSWVFRLLTVTTMAAGAWQWFSSSGLVLLHWISPAFVRTSAVLLLPFRTAASVPFACTALLCFVVLQELRHRNACSMPGTH